MVSKMNGLKITVVTPVYNGEKYIEDCLKSIMNQTYKNFEHIIMDGGSTDRTVEIAKKYEGLYNIKVFSQKDKGMYDAIANGFDKATGDIFCWLNSDDMLMPWAFDVMQMVVSKTSAQWCMGIQSHWEGNNVNYVTTKTRNFSQRTIKKGYHDNRVLSYIQQESTFWTRELWEKANKSFNLRDYKLAGDFHLWKNFAQYEPLYKVDSIISGFRHHADQKSADIQSYYKEVNNDSLLTIFYRKTKLLKILERFSGLFSEKNQIHMYDLINK